MYTGGLLMYVTKSQMVKIKKLSNVSKKYIKQDNEDYEVILDFDEVISEVEVKRKAVNERSAKNMRKYRNKEKKFVIK